VTARIKSELNFQITSEDCEGNTQTNHEEDYESIRKSSDLTPLEGSGNRWENTTPSKQDIPGVSALWESEAKINKELSEQRSIQVKKLEQELYLAAERLREAQDEETGAQQPCAQSRPSDQFGLTIEDKILYRRCKDCIFFFFFSSDLLCYRITILRYTFATFRGHDKGGVPKM